MIGGGLQLARSMLQWWGMTIVELIEKLQDINREHGNLDVIYCLYSDYSRMEPDDVRVKEAWGTTRGNPDVLSDHWTLSDTKPPRRGMTRQKFVLFPGN